MAAEPHEDVEHSAWLRDLADKNEAQGDERGRAWAGLFRWTAKRIERKAAAAAAATKGEEDPGP